MKGNVSSFSQLFHTDCQQGLAFIKLIKLTYVYDTDEMLFGTHSEYFNTGGCIENETRDL